jgi:hypothetical protein
LFRFNIETGSFSVSKQLKQTKDQPEQQQICLTINVPLIWKVREIFFLAGKYNSAGDFISKPPGPK